MVCGLALLLAAPLLATDYYVAPAPDGDDAHAGTLGSPWKTLQHAADLVGPGDQVWARAGDYAAFELTTSGNSGQRIRFAAYPGESVRIVTDFAGRGAGINLEGASYVTIEGFHIADRGTVGIRAVLCDGVTLRGNVLENNGKWGILTGCCDDLLIEGNLASGSIVEHGIYVGNSGDNPVIRGNVVFGNNANGIHMNGDVSIDCSPATTSDGVISNALVEGNTIFGNGAGGGSGINCDGVQDSEIRNNLIFATHASGISLYQIDGGGPSSGNRVEGNTVLVASDGRWALNIQDDSAGTVVRDNILWSDHASRGAMNVCDPGCRSGGFSSDYNGVEDRFTLDDGDSALTLAQWRSATGQDQHAFAISDLAALFVDAAGGNYHLAAGSDAVDAGTLLATLSTDLEGTPRPQASGTDAGALEGENVLFVDRFENGSTVRWSATAP